jgi:hypothetical protein
MLCREIITVGYENQMEHTNTMTFYRVLYLDSLTLWTFSVICVEMDGCPSSGVLLPKQNDTTVLLLLIWF